MRTGRPKQNVLSRFWALVDKSGECWIFRGAKNTGAGYGSFNVGGRKVGAHRFVWELLYGVIPPLMCVCHRCDNPACVRPAHLFLGTQKDNQQDAKAKGRRASGVRHKDVKLTITEVRAIKRRPAAASHNSIARDFGVDAKTIWAIRKGTTWQNVTI